MDTPASSGFIERHGLWSDAQKAAAGEIESRVAEHNLRTIRVAVADRNAGCAARS